MAVADPNAADLADGFLHSLAAGTQAHFRDDRMYAHRLGSLLEAYRDWSPTRPRPAPQGPTAVYLPEAQILVRRTADQQTVISAARGGVFKHFAAGREPVTDAGLILETADGQLAVSQSHDLTREIETPHLPLPPGEGRGEGDCQTISHSTSPAPALEANNGCLTVAGPLHRCRFETVTPLKQAIFHVGMVFVGRWCRTLVRRLLQRRLITGRRTCPVRLTRRFDFLPPGAAGNVSLRVTDTIELTSPTVQIRRMAFGTDHQAAYVAASGVYQQSVLRPWEDLHEYVHTLNEERRVVVVREF